MGLLRDLLHELKLPVLINIHNVNEARNTPTGSSGNALWPDQS